MSAVIYAAIVVMWAVVLVPMWLRRHDAAAETRSADRFSTAMRTLSRRTTAAPGHRYVVMPRRQSAPVSVHVSGAAAAGPTSTRSASTRPTSTRPDPARPTSTRGAAPRPAPARASAARRSLVARRRRLLLVLLAVTTLTLVLAAAQVITWPLQLVVDVVLVAFCIHLRQQARRAAAASRQRRRAASAPRRPARPAPARPAPARPTGTAQHLVAEPVVAEPAAGEDAAEGYAAEGYAAARAVHAPAPHTDSAVADRAAATFEAPGYLAGEGGPDVDVTWEPVPVPPPTYRMKPPAPAYEADPTYAPPTYEDVLRTQAPASAGPEPDGELDSILERRWAVND